MTLCFTIRPAAQEPGGSGHALLHLHSRIDTPWRQALHEAINPDGYECDGNTDFRLTCVSRACAAHAISSQPATVD